MRRILVAFICIALASTFSPVATAQWGGNCDGVWEANEDGVKCTPRDSSGGGSKEPVSWWASETSQAVVGLFALTASAAGGAYAYTRVRNRRRLLTTLLHALEDTFAAHKRRPVKGTRRMLATRAEIREHHASGRLDDSQFLELDKRAGNYLLRLRLLELDTRFPGLSPVLHGQIRSVMSDGRVTDVEADLLERQLDAMMLPLPTREALMVTIRAWANEDLKPRHAKVAREAPHARN